MTFYNLSQKSMLKPKDQNAPQGIEIDYICPEKNAILSAFFPKFDQIYIQLKRSMLMTPNKYIMKIYLITTLVLPPSQIISYSNFFWRVKAS